MHPVEEQQQAELVEASGPEATEAETVDEGAEDVVGLAVVGTKVKRRNGNQ